MNLRAVTFDFWATLALTDRPQSVARHTARLDALWSVLTATGATIDRDALSKLLLREWTHYNAVWEAEQRTLLNPERLAWLLTALGLDPLNKLEHDAICGAFDASLWCGEPTPAPGALAALQALSERGLKLAVISDTSFSTGRTLRRWLARHHMLPYFSALTFSDEAGRSKPHPDVFFNTLAALSVPPSAAAHIGDSLRTDISGALNVGMRALLYFPPSPPPPAPNPTPPPPSQPPTSTPHLHHFDDLLSALSIT